MWPFQATADNENGGHPTTTPLLMPKFLIFQDTGDGFAIATMYPPNVALGGNGYSQYLNCALPHPGVPAVKGKVRRGKPWGRPIKPIPRSSAPPSPKTILKSIIGGRRKRPLTGIFRKR